MTTGSEAPDRQLSRRSVVRTAAWSVPVVSLAVAAPSYAASGAISTFSWGQPVKWSNGNEKHVSWDLFLTNGPVPIQTISIAFAYAPNSGGAFTTFQIYGYSPTGPRDTTWSAPPTPNTPFSITATHATIAASSTTNIHSDFAGGDNSAGTVKANVTITYAGTPGSTTQTLGPVWWDSGNEHVHPA